MKYYKRLFAEKTLSFHEGANKCLRALMTLPFIGSHISKDIFDKQQSRIRTVVGVIYQIFLYIYEFAKKTVYFAIFIYFPYCIIGKYFPMIKSHGELTIIYMFFILSTVCGSLANNLILSLGDRDYLMIRVCMVSPQLNFLNRLIIKMITDFICYTIILTIYGVPFVHSLLLTIVTVCARPVGEVLDIISFDHIEGFYGNRSAFNGAVMAIAILLAYLVPILNGKLSYGWMFIVHPVFVVFMLIIGGLAMYFLWDYKNYRKMVRVAIHIKHEK